LYGSSYSTVVVAAEASEMGDGVSLLALENETGAPRLVLECAERNGVGVEDHLADDEAPIRLQYLVELSQEAASSGISPRTPTR
jgi:hypothetical protein